MPGRDTEIRVRELMNQAVEKGRTAGILLSVRQNGREVLYSQAGWADLERKIPIKRDTIFRLYSMTKPVTAAAAMILMEQGRLDLGENVEEYLPGFGATCTEDGPPGWGTAAKNPRRIGRY